MQSQNERTKIPDEFLVVTSASPKSTVPRPNIGESTAKRRRDRRRYGAEAHPALIFGPHLLEAAEADLLSRL